MGMFSRIFSRKRRIRDRREWNEDWKVGDTADRKSVV